MSGSVQREESGGKRLYVRCEMFSRMYVCISQLPENSVIC